MSVGSVHDGTDVISMVKFYDPENVACKSKFVPTFQ